MSEPVILVPLDGSEPALSALPVANALGAIRQAPLYVLQVGEPKPTGEELRNRLGGGVLAPASDTGAGSTITGSP
jgi:nucleotide-binding universal stress UspA family protein